MEIISEVGVPMTNGEVYALVRRRRDERNAAQHPPFCLQLQQADTNNRASSQYIASKFGGGAAAATARAGVMSPAPSERGVASPLDAANAANAVLATPAAGHLVILLTEVKLLNYLAHHAHLSAKGRVEDVYGPASVYEVVSARRAWQEEDAADADETHTRANGGGASSPAKDEHENTDRKTTRTKRKYAGEGLKEDDDDAKTISQYCARVQSTQPGTVAHVAAVDGWLHVLEERGQEQEAAWARAIKAARTRLSAPSAAKTAKLKGEIEDTHSTFLGVPLGTDSATQTTHAKTLSSYRVLLSAPTPLPVLQTLHAPQEPQGLVKHEHEDEDEEAPQPRTDQTGTGHTNAPMTSSSDPRPLYLTDEELLRLVVARPRSTLDVYRLLDQLEERFGGDEEKLMAWCGMLEEVFSSRIASRKK